MSSFCVILLTNTQSENVTEHRSLSADIINNQ